MYIAFYALIHPNVKWKEINHSDLRTIDDIDKLKKPNKE